MRGLRFLPFGALLAGIILWSLAGAADPKEPGQGPLSPRDEQATFRVLPGFRVELVASEPDVVDPVALAFDEDGRLFVAEMRGYPNGGVATGQITSGQVRLLEDRNGDGVFESSTVYADGLRFPSAVMPWRGGLIVGNAPDLIYLEDTDGDGRADRRRILYTGFGINNIQQLVNHVQYGVDNWVHGCAGGGGGTITCPEKPDWPGVTLRSRGIRFRPDRPGSLEPTSGGGQYGLAADDAGHWFTNTNSQHLRQIVLPDHYLRRNPALAVSAVTLDIPDHGAACQVFRISPFEAWRVERTSRRKNDPELSKRLSPNELVPGGYVTSGCSPVIYRADLFPAEFYGNSFICDPANNLIHRDRLVPNGAVFTAQRADSGCEFLASTNIWFRPTDLAVGPDGALYVLDFYREAIETPLSLPSDIKARMNLESQGRGRIWRVVPEGTKPSRPPRLRQAATAELVGHLAHPNAWWRLTAQRLIVERQDRSVVGDLERMVRESPSALGRMHALRTLEGLQALSVPVVEKALADGDARVRIQALQAAEPLLAASADVRAAACALAGDADPQVRFQAALSLGEAEGPEIVAALVRLARQDAADPWTQTAILSSAGRIAPALLETLMDDRNFAQGNDAPRLRLVARLATVTAARGSDADVARTLRLVSADSPLPPGWQKAILDGVGQGLRLGQRPLARLWEDPPPALKEAVERIRPFFVRAAAEARDPQKPLATRLHAVQLLAFGPYATAREALQELLTPQTPAEVQLAAVRALAQHAPAAVADLLLSGWTSYSPAVRREVLEALLARPERVAALLRAIEQQQVAPSQIEPDRLDQLRNHPDPKLRQQARRLLANLATPDRQKVLADYRSVLELPADAGRGKGVFKKICATCHRLEDVGVEVGPNLLGALRNKTKEALLIDILDPSREVDPRYINYQVTTVAGRSFTGMIAADTATAITLRRAENAEDTILRDQIEVIVATTKSVMPEGLESQLSKQDVADVIAYLLSVAVPR
ncbi:MAG: HEAT repeat domain-containing protein [Gemmataceae bacterium]|nr:HEAT repeat domain-containing protein [Gemmataceae bacterium]MDW8264966.1 HEAT repeat domain-containing protein [Gemmataceae bacterium]